MQKDVSGLVATLAKSVIEISGSGAEDSEDLLKQSIAQFETTLLATLEPILPSEQFQPLAKGLNHIGLFANTLRDAVRGVEAIKNGLAKGDDEAETNQRLDRFIDVGVLTLRSMVNDTAELPEDEDDLERAEAAGELVKIEGFDGTEYLLKSQLPAELQDYFVGPYDLVSEYATVGRMFTDEAIGIVDVLSKSEMIPLELMDAFPELFETDDDLGKLDDENVGAGADPNTAPDPGDAAGDDATQNPVELMVRMASIIVVVGGSLLQAQGQGADMDAGAEATEDPNQDAGGEEEDEDPTAAAPPMAPAAAKPPMPGAKPNPFDKKKANPFGKQEVRFEDIPLEKILGGEIMVSDSVADALEESFALRKSVAALTAKQTSNEELILKMQGVIDKMNAQPAMPKGAVFAMGKTEDSVYGGPARASEQDLAKLAEVNPDAAARELLKIVHSGGGAPMLPPNR